MSEDIVPSGALVYLATPYSKYHGGDIELAFREAAALAAKLMRAGMKVYSPIAHTHPLAVYGKIDPLDHSIWLPFDEAMMKVCDVLVIAHMDGWDVSKGIAHEIEFFTNARKPIFDLDPVTLTSVKRKPPAACSTRMEYMGLEDLREERAYWDARIREATSWGGALTAAAEFRNECDRWIKRREDEQAKAEALS